MARQYVKVEDIVVVWKRILAPDDEVTIAARLEAANVFAACFADIGGRSVRTAATEEVPVGDSHRQTWVQPTIGAGGAGWVVGAAVQSGGPAGTFGAYADVIPAGVTLAEFTLFAINIEVPYVALVGGCTYELVIASGGPGAEVEQARVRFTRSATEETVNGIPVKTNMLPAGTRIRARLAASQGGPLDLAVSVEGHYYD